MADLTKRGDPRLSLEIGDEYTIIRDEPVAKGDGSLTEVGDVIQQIPNTAVGGLYFEIVAITNETVYTTRYRGRFRDMFPDAPDNGPADFIA